MGKIRVGLIRCDTHGMYYGPQMAKHDPALFDLPTPWEPDPRHSWMRGGNHYYFYTNYGDPRQMTAPVVEGFEVVKLWDEQRSVAEVASRVLCGKPQICDSLEEVSDDVDLVFIGDCNGDGSDHLELASPGLKKGVTTFVDKPFAHRLDDVKQLLELAAGHNVPVMSLSILQMVPGIRHFARRLEELGHAQFGTIQGGGTHRAGLIHTTCMALTVYGSGVSTVRAVTGPSHTSVHLDWDQQPDRPEYGVMINCDAGTAWHCSMHLSAYGPGARGAIHSPGIGDWEFPEGSAEILRLVKKMVETGKPQGPVDQMIEAVAIADAADQAIATGQPCEVQSTAGLARTE